MSKRPCDGCGKRRDCSTPCKLWREWVTEKWDGARMEGEQAAQNKRTRELLQELRARK